MKMLIHFLPVFTTHCIKGINANLPYIERNIDKNPSIVTFLNPIIGYDKAAEIAKQAIAENKSIKAVLREKELFTEDQLKTIFSSEALLPHKSSKK